MNEWLQVQKEKFIEFLKSRQNVQHNLFAISEPPISFYWDQTCDGKDWSFGKGSIAKVIRNDISSIPGENEYFIRIDLI